MRDKIVLTALIAVAYIAFAHIGARLAVLPGSPIPLLMPAAGIALAVLLLRGNAGIPGIFIGALVSNTILAPDIPDTPISAAGIFVPVGLTLGPVVAAGLLRRFAPSAPIWANAGDLLRGTACIAVACILSTSIGIGTITYLGLLPTRYPLDAYGMWWLGEFCGMLMMTAPAFLIGDRVLPRDPGVASPGGIVSPTLVNAAFVAAAVAGFWLVWDIEGRRITQALTREATVSANSLSGVLRSAGRDLESIRAYIQARGRATEDSFLRYTTTEFGDLAVYPGARALGWAPRVFDPRGWELDRIANGSPPSQLFEVDGAGTRRPVADRADYFPLELTYPLNEFNRSAIGFDLGSESVRRSAINRARDTGELSMTAPIYLVQSEGRVPGMFMCWPIYRNGARLETEAQRRDALIGIAAGVYHIADVFDLTVTEPVEDISLHVMDPAQPEGEQWYHSKLSDTRYSRPARPPSSIKALEEGYHGRAMVRFTDQEWAVVATPGPAFEFLYRTAMPWGILGLILALGMGISAIMIERISARQRLELERKKTEEALHAARAANESKSYFMAAASHDIKQPLQALGYLTDSLLMTNPPEHARPILESLKTSIKEMSQHFDTLMDVGRFQDGSFKVRTATFSLQELSRRIDQEIGPLCRAKGLTWIIEFDDCNVTSDPDLLLRLMRNLLMNAVRYTESGEVRCTARRRDNVIEFNVSDSGPGLSPDQQQLVFGEIRQIHNNDIHTSGLGLGLSIVNRISRSLDLGMQVSSIAGEGTTFSFQITNRPPD